MDFIKCFYHVSILFSPINNDYIKILKRVRNMFEIDKTKMQIKSSTTKLDEFLFD